MKMFSKEILNTKGNTSIVSRDLNINGTLNCEGNLEIEGSIEGDIVGQQITIRENGYVKGNVISSVLNIKGKFVGSIKSERINISSKGNINGTFEYISLCVEDGACIEGELKRVSEIKTSGKNSILKNNKILNNNYNENKDEKKDDK